MASLNKYLHFITPGLRKFMIEDLKFPLIDHENQNDGCRRKRFRLDKDELSERKCPFYNRASMTELADKFLVCEKHFYSFIN